MALNYSDLPDNSSGRHLIQQEQMTATMTTLTENASYEACPIRRRRTITRIRQPIRDVVAEDPPMTVRQVLPHAAIEPMTVARALGGEYRNGKIHAPGPGHSKRDRSLIVWLDPNAPNGFRVHSFADDPIACRDYISAALGFEAWTPGTQSKARRPVRSHSPARAAAVEREQQALRTDRIQQARWLWSCRCPISGTIAETYFRQVRGYHGPLHGTLGFLPARGEFAPAIIAAFGLPQEPEPGRLSMPVDSIAAVHLIRLRGDGLGKVAEKPKITIGSPSGMPIVVAPLNDGLALAITEGIEDALSVSGAGFGAWAAGSAGFMPSLSDSVPAYTDAVTVVADNNSAGVQAADELARRLTVRGIHVERIFPEGEGVS